MSHQLDRVVGLCDHAVLLTQGAVVRSGSAPECVAAYVDGEHLASQPSGTPCPIALAALETPSPLGACQGQRVTLHVRGSITGPGAASLATIGIWLRTVPGEDVVCGTHSAACDVMLPETGAFNLEIDLQMNVAPGLYRARLSVWNLEERSEWARGPSILIQVDRARSATLYLNSDVRSTSSARSFRILSARSAIFPPFVFAVSAQVLI